MLDNVHIELANVELGDWAKAYNPKKKKKKAVAVPRQLVDFGFIENSTTGHVFEVQAAQAGASVVMYSKHGDGTQMFKLAPVKGTDFSHIESGAAAGLVLECQDHRGNKGAALVLARASKRANYQYFKPVPVPGKQDTYYLESHLGRVRRRHGTAPAVMSFLRCCSRSPAAPAVPVTCAPRPPVALALHHLLIAELGCTVAATQC